jgi:hypothetical protein
MQQSRSKTEIMSGSLKEEDVKEYLQQVIREVKKQKPTTNKPNNGNT